MNTKLTEFLNSNFNKEQVLFDEPMSRHTTFKVGGPAKYFIRPSDAEALASLIAFLKKEKISYYVTGNGSNLLVSDKGYDGVIISTSAMDEVTVDGNRIVAAAGAMNSRIASAALEHSLSGMEALSGIPGSIGGGVTMNAGAYGSEMKDIVELVEAITPEGKRVCLSNEQMDFSYRSSAVRKLGLIVVSVILCLSMGDRELIKEDMGDYAARRRDKQPLEYPSAGSTFKRPAGNYAGKLIEEAGLKGFSVGSAAVSDKHAGFVINKGGASADDVYQVIRQVQDRVEEKSGIRLETEVVLLGEFE
ncbi:UDP-N-acetylmuramate dehydrogenase [Butyrivibrio sp. MC2013]|uniref:UDP-N-acetylmuramate dehydrogenase n=1 Tax=Butyrivibrio sp. MC2013 TaxID=1280686 RepID=UPI0003F99062|nr:UDP-N-acetylmuramate dehydrogenase [Butyrivibrio sp. MC2013]